MDSTRTATGPGAAAGALRAPQLYVVTSCSAPLGAPARISLANVDQVAFGRGEARRIRGTERHVAVELSDPWLSAEHATLLRRLSAWVFRDEGSKNGSIVNGQIVSEAALSDGDVIELGRTFFLFREAQPLGDAAPISEPADAALTVSLAFAAALEDLALAAPTRVPVLLRGESGVGKELAARRLHALSRRRGPFVAVNCGALPEELVESELFGAKAGAFSGATVEREGFFRAADGGTLLLDEIGDLSAASQAALLRVLQEHEVTPLGSTRPIPIDVRLVAATHRDLTDMVSAGLFRRDLLARIAGFQLDLPPLRERREDLGLLVAAILRAAAPGRDVTLHPTLVRALFAHPFPGNVRELEKCLSAAIALAAGAPVALEHAPAWFQAGLSGTPDRPLVGEDQRRRIALLALLREHDGNVAAVARAMGKARMQVQRWMKRYGIARGSGE